MDKYFHNDLFGFQHAAPDAIRTAGWGTTAVKPAPKPVQAIVCLLGTNGQPLPASKPFIHQSLSAAEAEATRLSQGSPGADFAVFVAFSKFSTPKPDTKRTAL